MLLASVSVSTKIDIIVVFALYSSRLLHTHPFACFLPRESSVPCSPCCYKRRPSPTRITSSLSVRTMRHRFRRGPIFHAAVHSGHCCVLLLEAALSQEHRSVHFSLNDLHEDVTEARAFSWCNMAVLDGIFNLESTARWSLSLSLSVSLSLSLSRLTSYRQISTSRLTSYFGMVQDTVVAETMDVGTTASLPVPLMKPLVARRKRKNRQLLVASVCR